MLSGLADRLLRATSSSNRRERKKNKSHRLTLERLSARRMLVAPVIVDVEVAGSQWSDEFTDYLAANDFGQRGFSIASDPSASLSTLPWANIDRLRVTFDQPVDVQAFDLTLRGVSMSQYQLSDFQYDAVSQSATWSLDEPITADKLLIRLSDRIQNPGGQQLDGDWPGEAGSQTSGDGEEGGNFLLRFDVLPGDVDRDQSVDFDDMAAGVQTLFHRTVDAGYSPFADVDGSSANVAGDLIRTRNRRGYGLPVGDPDGAPPTISVELANDTAPGGGVDNDGVTSDSTLAGTIVDGSDIAAFRVAIDSRAADDYSVLFAGVTLRSGFTFSLTPAQLEMIHGGPLGDGEHTVYFVAEDLIGNASNPLAFTFTLDSSQNSPAAAGSPGANPTVERVSFRSSQWTPAFEQAIAAAGLGSDGFAIPASISGQLAPLPWIDLNQVKIRFDRDVVVTQGDLEVRGNAAATYAFAGFQYNAASRTATWTLAAPIGTDKLVLDLSDDVRDTLGNRLDGEWPNSFGVFPSGDGVAGGDFLFRVNVLPGDVERDADVDRADLMATLRNAFRTAGGSGYDVFADINGNGVISVDDAVLTRNGSSRPLPVGDPVGARR